MRHANLFVTAMICGTVIITAGMFAKAGDLNPPVGAIQPSMHTLDEIYDEVAGLPNVFPIHPCEPDSWEIVSVDIPQLPSPIPVTELIPSGSGILHAVFESGDINARSMTLRSVQSDETLIVLDPVLVGREIDIRYQDGIEILIDEPSGGENASSLFQILYRPDPQP